MKSNKVIFIVIALFIIMFVVFIIIQNQNTKKIEQQIEASKQIATVEKQRGIMSWLPQILALL